MNYPEGGRSQRCRHRQRDYPGQNDSGDDALVSRPGDRADSVHLRVDRDALRSVQRLVLRKAGRVRAGEMTILKRCWAAG